MAFFIHFVVQYSCKGKVVLKWKDETTRREQMYLFIISIVEKMDFPRGSDSIHIFFSYVLGHQMIMHNVRAIAHNGMYIIVKDYMVSRHLTRMGIRCILSLDFVSGLG